MRTTQAVVRRASRGGIRQVHNIDKQSKRYQKRHSDEYGNRSAWADMYGADDELRKIAHEAWERYLRNNPEEAGLYRDARSGSAQEAYNQDQDRVSLIPKAYDTNLRE